MNVTLVEINIKPERVDEFLEVFRANHEGAIQEPGNLRFDVLQDPRFRRRPCCLRLADRSCAVRCVTGPSRMGLAMAKNVATA